MGNVAYYDKFQEVSTAKKKLIFVFPYKAQFLSDDLALPIGRMSIL
jgi:hypothetical protein